MDDAETNSGEALLHIGSVAGRSVVLRSQARNPLRLLTPCARGKSVWAYTSSLGGGMVAGDCTRLEVMIDAGARCFLGTQASTKVYRNPARLPCSHALTARVGEEALLILAPDPVQSFADSSYEQHQHFTLAATANLLFVDWMSSGRTARGERWRFRCYSSRNEVEREGRKLLIDALRLDAADGALDSGFRGAGFNCFATVALFGPRLASAAAEILDWTGRQTSTPKAGVVFAASPLHEGAILRLAGTSVEEVGRSIHARVGFVRQWLDDDPWSRKW
jgi:urease accessory protein